MSSSSTSRRKLSFTDLPAEIRNDIYVWALFIRNDKIVMQHPSGVPGVTTGVELSDRMRGFYSPFSTQRLERAGHLWHADPVIWQLNRQIRHEARSLYITKFLSIDLARACATGVPRMNLITRSFQLFEQWLQKNVEPSLRRAITSIEVHDWVFITADKTCEIPKSMPRLVVDKGFVEYLPALKIILQDGGRNLAITAPLRLHPASFDFLNTKVHGIAASTLKNMDTTFVCFHILQCLRAIEGMMTAAASSRLGPGVCRDYSYTASE